MGWDVAAHALPHSHAPHSHTLVTSYVATAHWLNIVILFPRMTLQESADSEIASLKSQVRSLSAALATAQAEAAHASAEAAARLPADAIVDMQANLTQLEGELQVRVRLCDPALAGAWWWEGSSGSGQGLWGGDRSAGWWAAMAVEPSHRTSCTSFPYPH